ncbi:hypothetical protein K7432_013466 [Basidiobolus ranarum]
MFQTGHYELVQSKSLFSFRIQTKFLISNTLSQCFPDVSKFNQVKGAVSKRVGILVSDTENWRGETLGNFVRESHKFVGCKVFTLTKYVGNISKELFPNLELDKEKLRIGTEGTKLGIELATLWKCEEKLDLIIYIGEDHLKQHVAKLQQLLLEISENCPDILHLPYGPLTKPTLSKEEILHASQLEMQELMKESENRYEDLLNSTITINESEDICLLHWISQVLSQTNWVVQLLQIRRQKSSKFSYERMLDAKGHSGVYLQYTHARITGIERKSDIQLNSNCDLGTLVEPEVRQLIWLLATFSWHLEQSYTTLEPCILIHYLFQLSIAISNGLSVLRVKDKNPLVSEPRWMLFWCSREILRLGFQLLGLTPLDKM